MGAVRSCILNPRHLLVIHHTLHPRSQEFESTALTGSHSVAHIGESFSSSSPFSCMLMMHPCSIPMRKTKSGGGKARSMKARRPRCPITYLHRRSSSGGAAITHLPPPPPASRAGLSGVKNYPHLVGLTNNIVTESRGKRNRINNAFRATSRSVSLTLQSSHIYSSSSYQFSDHFSSLKPES